MDLIIVDNKIRPVFVRIKSDLSTSLETELPDPNKTNHRDIPKHNNVVPMFRLHNLVDVKSGSRKCL